MFDYEPGKFFGLDGVAFGRWPWALTLWLNPALWALRYRNNKICGFYLEIGPVDFQFTRIEQD